MVATLVVILLIKMMETYRFYQNKWSSSNRKTSYKQTNGCLQVGEPSGIPGEVMQIRKASDVEVTQNTSSWF